MKLKRLVKPNGFSTLVWILIVVVIGVLVILGTGWFIARVLRGLSPNELPPGSFVTEEGYPIGLSPTEGLRDQSNIPLSWQLYESEINGYQIFHPPDVMVEPRPMDEIRFIKFGPTQELGTEFYDGIHLTISSGKLGELSLEAFAQLQYQNNQSDPVLQSISPFQAVSIAGLEGYQFTVVSFGEFEHTFLPKGDESYIYLIDATADPTGQGFDEIVELIKSSISIN